MHKEYLKQYAEDILSGTIPANIKIKKQYEILYRQLLQPTILKVRNQDGELEEREFIFDLPKANRCIDFKERFCKVNNAGRLGPMKMALFQKASDQALFGFVDKETGYRLHKKRFTVIGRKNGKTTDKAGTGLYMLVGDNEYAAQVACIATSKPQANLLFKPASVMVKRSDFLSKIIRKRKSDLYYDDYDSSFEPLATQVNSLDGLDLHYGVIDEIHAAKGREIYDDLIQATSARNQAIIDIISTFGFIREDLFDNLYDMADNELSNEDFYEPTNLNLIYELDSREEIEKPEIWLKANPGLGTIKKYSYIETKLKEARKNPSFMPTVLTKDFNVPSTKAGNFFTYDEINNRTIADMNYLKNSYSIGGCDLSAVGDLTCATHLIRKPNDENIYFLQHYFIPESKLDKVEKSKDKEAPYRLWSEQKYVTITPGAQVEYTHVTRWFVQMMKDYNIRPLDIGYDRALSGYWVPEMEGYGFKLTKIAQGPFTWTQPMKELKSKFEEGKIIYQDNPVTRWCLNNVGAKESIKEKAIKTMEPIKLGANRRIDGFVSMLNAYTCYLKVYEDYMPYVK